MHTQHIGPRLAEQGEHAAVEAHDRAQRGEDRGEAHDLELRRIAVGRQAGALQALAADAEGLESGLPASQRLQDARTVEIRAGLAHHHHHARRPAEFARSGGARRAGEAVEDLEQAQEADAHGRSERRTAEDVQREVHAAGDAAQPHEARGQQEEPAAPAAEGIDQTRGPGEGRHGMAGGKGAVLEARADDLERGCQSGEFGASHRVLVDRQPPGQHPAACGLLAQLEDRFAQRPGAVGGGLQGRAREAGHGHREADQQEVLRKAASVEEAQAQQ